MIRATRETTAGRRYLDLQRAAQQSKRPTDELIQLYALECFLDRLTRSRFANHFVLKGGVLLAALGARRPTRDIDLAARALDNDAQTLLTVAKDIAAIELDDGIVFDADRASIEVIREDGQYSGARVKLSGTLSRALVRLHVDINIGDPIWPEPQQVQLPRLLDGVLKIRGYSVGMVLAEKIVTAIARGTENTRWRDFVDIYALVRQHDIDGKVLRQSLQRVAEYRDVALVSLQTVLADYAGIAQQRWLMWVKKQRIGSNVPTQFSVVLDLAIRFADPVIADGPSTRKWDSTSQCWI